MAGIKMKIFFSHNIELLLNTLVIFEPKIGTVLLF